MQLFEQSVVSGQQQTITIFIDAQFQFAQDQPALRQWLGLSVPSLARMPVTAVFPELQSMIGDLQQKNAITLNRLVHQHPSPCRKYDLQLESTNISAELPFLLTFICRTAASSNNSTEIARLTKHNLTLQLLNRAGRILTETLDAQEVLERLLQVATQLIGAAGSSVWLWDEDNDWLICRAAFHPGSAEALVNQRVRRGQGIAGWVADTGECAVVENTRQDQRFTPHVDAQSGFTTDALIAVPLVARGQVSGVLEVVNKLEGSFQKEDLTLAEMLAASASIAIDNAHLVTRLRRQMHDLQQKNEELDAFDHTVAHNLQNPLALIIGFGEMLHISDELSGEQQQQAVNAIVGNAHKMSNIVHELLLLSSVRKSDVECTPLDMAVPLENAIKRLQSQIDSSQAQIVQASSWPVALGHPGWIEEVWENYLSNAVKYGGTPPHIECGATEMEDGRIQFWVKDNGSGIPEKDQANLFAPFTRLNQVRVTGHGLGLSIVQRIIEKLDGEVGVISAVGKGSTFFFILPVT